MNQLSLDRICVLGNRLLSEESSGNCTKEEGSPLWEKFCEYREMIVNNISVRVPHCDPYFDAHNVTRTKGIKGLASGVFLGKQYKDHFSYSPSIMHYK